MTCADHRAWIRSLVLVIGLAIMGSARAHAWKVTRLDVQARLDNDGRLQVTETLHATLGKGAESEFRSFGLSVDQSIFLKGVTRIDADGKEHILVDQEVDGPDQYRYYPRGHVYFRYPPIAGDTFVKYRFQYELVNAISPVWGLGAGPEPLTPDAGFIDPWRRFQAIVADAREAWTDPGTRYRLDHSVLFPDRGVSKDEPLEINYRLDFDTAWREVDPRAERARVTPLIEYRVRRLFEFLAPGSPVAATKREAALRIGSVVAVIGLGLLLYVGMVVLEALAVRRGGLSPSMIGERLSSLAPEEITARVQAAPPSMSAFRLLERLASEGKIAIDVDSPADQQGREEIRMRLLVPRESLPPFEREFLLTFFLEEGENVTSSDRIRRAYRDVGFRPDTTLHSLIAASAAPGKTGISLVTIPFYLVGFWGVFQQIMSVPYIDLLPAVILVNLAAIAVTLCWPKGWWHGDRSSWGLLIPLVLLATLFAALHFGINRPFAVEAWIGSAFVVLAFHIAQLINSRMRNSGADAVKRDLIRIRKYAESELSKPQPRLDDRWVPHLMALGLGQPIDDWRQRFGESLISTSSVPDDAASPVVLGAPFTGRLPEPFVGPPDWADAFSGDDLEDDDDWEDDDCDAPAST